MSTNNHKTISEELYDRVTFVETVAENRGWFMTLGILITVLGLMAIVFPLASSIAVETVVGISMLLGGIGFIFHAFANASWGGFIFTLLAGIVWAGAGSALLTYPAEGLTLLTVIVAAAFMAQGIIKTAFAFRMKPHKGWGWVLFGGIVAFLVGFMLTVQIPFSSLWALGLLAGINILVSGWALLMFTIASGEAADEVDDAAAELGIKGTKAA